MALINCPECNKEISDKAQSCPHCGCPINLNSKYSIHIVGYRDTDTAVSAGLLVADLNLKYYFKFSQVFLFTNHKRRHTIFIE